MAYTDASKNPFRLTLKTRNPIWNQTLNLTSRLIERTGRLNALNQLYQVATRKPDERNIAERILQALNVSHDISDADIQRIPKTGPVVIVANHPFGGIEGVILLSALARIRSDAKVMVNYLVSCVPELHPLCIFVDPYGRRDSKARNFRSIMECVRWLKQDRLLIVFPAGDVSGIDLQNRRIADPAWSESTASLIRITKSRVVPVYFEGSNGPLFQLAGLVHPRIRTAMLPTQLLNKKNRRFDVRIGNCVSFERLKTFKSDADMIQYLRLRCHILAHRDRAKPEIGLERKTARIPIIGPVLPSQDSEVLAREVSYLPEEQCLVRSDHFHVYYAAASQVPELLREIGRLREITFCAAGEGTGRLLDLDRFDAYYLHLFLWNDKTHELVGAYRFGLTDTIVRRFGVRGLYTTTLFKYGKPLLTQLDPAIELGRSFVRPEYQRAYAPLWLLWKGIGQFVVRNPRYRYLFGPVSMSREYNAYSRHLLSAFLQINNLDADKARVVRARNPPRPIDSAECTPQTLRKLVTNLEAVSELIGEIEPDQKNVPVLIRQYLKLGGRIMAFNVDPQFNHVLDALMAVDISKIDRALQARIMTAEGAASYLAACA